METKRSCQLTALLGLLVNFYYEKVGNKKIKRKVVFNVAILCPTGLVETTNNILL